MLVENRGRAVWTLEGVESGVKTQLLASTRVGLINMHEIYIFVGAPCMGRLTTSPPQPTANGWSSYTAGRGKVGPPSKNADDG